jgi:protein-disulfide isomerase
VEDPVIEQPHPAAAVSPKPTQSSIVLGLVTIAATVALAIAVATWIADKRQIEKLQHDLAALRDAQQQLALETTGKKSGSGSVGQIIDVAKVPGRGRQDAVVTLVEFSDYECPFCIRHLQQTMPLIDKNYISSGKIRYVFRDFPIDTNHPQAIKAHEAARCALEQDKFWDLHTKLFSAPGTHTPLALEDRAKEANLSDTAFRSCIASGRTTAAIRETVKVGEDLGITGTPWFFVGLRDLATERVRVLKPIGGAQPYEQFATALDEAIKQADGK